MPLIAEQAGQTMVRLLVIRHGETDWNAANRIQGQLDVALNARGEEQAQAVAQRLAEEEIHELWSSDLKRANQTALHINDAHHAKIKLDVRLRERHFGILQGLTYEEAKKQHPERYHGYMQSYPEEGFGNGETLFDFYLRSKAFFVERARQTPPGKTVVAVTHGGVVSCLYRFAKKIPLAQPRDWAMPNAAVNEFFVEQDAWRVGRFADISHLAGALDDA